MAIMRPIMKKIGADITIIVRKGADSRHITELKEEVERIIKI